MPDSLVEAVNRLTAASTQSPSEIVCDALRRYLAEQPFFDRDARPKSKLWIN